jgi:hypothetical protein
MSLRRTIYATYRRRGRLCGDSRRRSGAVPPRRLSSAGSVFLEVVPSSKTSTPATAQRPRAMGCHGEQHLVQNTVSVREPLAVDLRVDFLVVEAEICAVIECIPGRPAVARHGDLGEIITSSGARGSTNFTVIERFANDIS